MKKPLKFPKPKTDEIFKALDMAERTQRPPSEELISRSINSLQSLPSDLPIRLRKMIRCEFAIGYCHTRPGMPGYSLSLSASIEDFHLLKP